jgi:Putative peptidoglycan binding domain
VRERPRRRRRRGALAAAVLVVVAGTGAGVAVTHPFGGRAKPATPDSGAPTALATVTGGRLSAQTSVNGTLGYADGYDVIDQAKGTLTWLPSVGQVVRQGHPLYRVDGEPVVLLQGARVPLYRALSEGMSGTDVRQLNADLVALGYATDAYLNPRSDYFGAATVDALERLQKHVGVDQTGSLALGQAVFLPAGAARIAKVNATVAGTAMPGTTLLQVTSTTREVIVALDAAAQAEVKVGDAVTITLPGDQTTPGTVSSVGTVAKASQGGSSTITVRITPKDPAATGRLDQAPVQVSIATDTVADALAVPVTALLALAGGGYALEVVDGGGAHRLVPVSVGLFDDSAGTVQVTGDGVAAGQRIVVPAS